MVGQEFIGHKISSWRFTRQKDTLFIDVYIIKYCPKIKSNHIMISSPMHLMLDKKGLPNGHSIIGCINAVDFYKYAQNLEWCNPL